MVTILSWAWKIAAWTALLVGAVWTGRVDVGGETHGGGPHASIAVTDSYVESEVRGFGGATVPVQLMFVLSAFRSDADLRRFQDWIESGPDVFFHVQVQDAGYWGVAGKDLRMLRTVDSDRITVAKGRIGFSGGDVATVSVRVSGTDEDWRDYRPEVHIGNIDSLDAPPPRHLRKTFSEALPGLVFLGGGLGCLVHVFMIVARLLVPLRPPLPPAEHLSEV